MVRGRKEKAKDEENGNNTSDKKNLRLFKTYRVQVLVREVHRQSFQVENHLLPLLCCFLPRRRTRLRLFLSTKRGTKFEEQLIFILAQELSFLLQGFKPQRSARMEK